MIIGPIVFVNKEFSPTNLLKECHILFVCYSITSAQRAITQLKTRFLAIHLIQYTFLTDERMHYGVKLQILIY